MRHRARRWLFHRRKPNLQPLYQRTSWYDFAGRMHRAISIDMQLLLGEVTRADLRVQQKTRPVPAVEYDAPTVADHPRWIYADETERVESSGVDMHTTQEMKLEEIVR
ncbi:MAG: hypothetical protein ACRDHW_04020 [Ktedonobacteraceae bacterium]